MPRCCYQMQHALPERIGAKQKRLPREAASVSATTTGETTVNHTLDKIAIATGTAPQSGQQYSLPQGAGAVMAMRDEGITQFVARLPTPMHQELKRLAKAADRSLNTEIVRRLAQSLGEDFAAEQPAAQPALAEMLAQMREQTGYLRELLDFARATAEQSRTSDELITTPIN